jgi:hypothetical protein
MRDWRRWLGVGVGTSGGKGWGVAGRDRSAPKVLKASKYGVAAAAEGL